MVGPGSPPPPARALKAGPSTTTGRGRAGGGGAGRGGGGGGGGGRQRRPGGPGRPQNTNNRALMRGGRLGPPTPTRGGTGWPRPSTRRGGRPPHALRPVPRGTQLVGHRYQDVADGVGLPLAARRDHREPTPGAVTRRASASSPATSGTSWSTHTSTSGHAGGPAAVAVGHATGPAGRGRTSIGHDRSTPTTGACQPDRPARAAPTSSTGPAGGEAPGPGNDAAGQPAVSPRLPPSVEQISPSRRDYGGGDGLAGAEMTSTVRGPATLSLGRCETIGETQPPDRPRGSRWAAGRRAKSARLASNGHGRPRVRDDRPHWRAAGDGRRQRPPARRRRRRRPEAAEQGRQAKAAKKAAKKEAKGQAGRRPRRRAAEAGEAPIPADGPSRPRPAHARPRAVVDRRPSTSPTDAEAEPGLLPDLGRRPRGAAAGPRPRAAPRLRLVLPLLPRPGAHARPRRHAEQILLQAVGSADDPASGGRQMPRHWGDVERNVVTQSSPTGSQCIPAVGCAEAGRYIVRRPQLGLPAHGDEVTYVSLGRGRHVRGRVLGEPQHGLHRAPARCCSWWPTTATPSRCPSAEQSPAPISELVRGFAGLQVHRSTAPTTSRSAARPQDRDRPRAGRRRAGADPRQGHPALLPLGRRHPEQVPVGPGDGGRSPSTTPSTASERALVERRGAHRGRGRRDPRARPSRSWPTRPRRARRPARPGDRPRPRGGAARHPRPGRPAGRRRRRARRARSARPSGGRCTR